MSWESSYDQWKTACCGNYPHCSPCPYDTDDEIDWDEMDEDDPADIAYEKYLARQLEED